jgi:mono/diheme cytochrome c family protein
MPARGRPVNALPTGVHLKQQGCLTFYKSKEESIGMAMCLRLFAGRRIAIAALMVFTLRDLGTVAESQAISSADSTMSLFKSNCAVCHAPDGSGTALGKRLHTPDLRSQEIRQLPAETLVKTISAGKNSMPPFADKLTSDEILKLVDYIRQFHEGTADHPK